MLYEKTNYTADISYLTNTFIYEYDISKCNINILYIKGIINQEVYNMLYNAPRMRRQVYIGNMQKDKAISKILSDGILEARKMLFESNNILDREILSIKKDAIFIINRKLQNTTFGNINFVLKNVYTSFFKINNLELYYFYSNINKEEYLHVKGIGKEKVSFHNNYFIQILKDIFYSIQINGASITLKMIKDIYLKYVNKSFQVEYYREFDADSKYSVINSPFKLETANENSKHILNINKNLSILMQLQQIVSNIYFNTYR